MMISTEWLPEPKLQFAQYFEHEDAKTGLAEYGPFGRNVSGLHPAEVKLGFIGTRETIAGARQWVQECAAPIESENIKRVRRPAESLEADGDDPSSPVQVRLEKILNRDFAGFSNESPFHCSFALNERWERPIDPREISQIIALEKREERIHALVNLFDAEVQSLASVSPQPNVIIIALTSEMADRADSVRVTGNFHLNLRRLLKARTMRWGVPIQLIRHSTVLGKGRRGSPLQEKATRAWNFCTAQYYKAEGVPWRPVDGDQDVCFIGVSFYVARDINDRLSTRASVAQAFDFLGQGFVLRGEPFQWDQQRQGRTPHLLRVDARRLISRTLGEYVKVSRHPPRRVVVHKTSAFWGSSHGDYDELEGFYEGVGDVFPGCETDFVTLRQTGVRLFREGMYPPLRGTLFTVGDREHFLYTQGFTPYLETYPGAYVPEPWHLAEHHGGGAPRDLLRDVLRLTKMNVNNCAFADGTPITLSFSRMIGEIMQHIPEDGIVQPHYRFYM
jgi:hypothetical protein